LVIDRAADAHTSIFNGAAASQRLAGNFGAAETIGRAGLPAGLALGALSQGYGAVRDHAEGMSVGRSVAIHGTGFAGGYLGGEAGVAAGFALGEAVFPPGGGIVGAIIGGLGGAYGGGKLGEAAGAAGATALGMCR
jgi:hypothetical protein